ncbi:MAG: type II toxin-antitoxin system VapC family toxin [Gemmatimonadetes bacterium]|nr:type II toxin-antitoxin system VapC family toxin [Gemmatimonadota bacterium]
MIVYAESSAVLAWLFGESDGQAIRDYLAAAQRVFASRLTLAECSRALVRAVLSGVVREGTAAELRARVALASRHWVLSEVSESVLERAGRPFPGEPLRTLDAIHIATALAVQEAEPGLALLSLDERVRRAARELGIHMLPEAPRS